MKKVLVIAGPTASGKSDLAAEMAVRYHGVVLSGDSIQVYQGFDIGSGKVTEAEKRGVKHYLLDIRDPKDGWSAADFQREVRQIIAAEDHLCIICGGTGLYLKAALYDYTFPEEEVHSDPSLEQYDNDTLYALLKEKDPVQAEKIHPHNRRRIIRALTIMLNTGKRMSDINAAQRHEPLYDMYIIGLTMDREVLYARINRRVEKMFQMGLKQEVEGLLAGGVTWNDPAMKGIGYAEWQPYFAGEITEEEVKENIQKNSRHFAKRQYTWFRHQLPVHWYVMPEEKEQILKDTEEWYEQRRDSD